MQVFIFLLYLKLCFISETSSFWFGRTNLKCGDSSSRKNLEISSPGIVPLECSYTLMAFSPFICQVRIDFDITLAPPSIPTADNQIDYAQCLDDVMYIGDFKLCGRDRNQHLYISLDRKNSVRSLEVRFRTTDRSLRPELMQPQWKLQINQLKCPSESRMRGLSEDLELLPVAPRTFFNDDEILIAPVGCSQYYSRPSGLFTTFNFNSGNGVYPGDMNYAICFHRISPNDKLSLKAFQFQLGELIPNIPSEAHVGEVCLPKIHTEGRSEDYILIPAAEIMEKGIRSTYFCGNSIHQASVISSAPGPIALIFHSDKIYTDAESGFGFTYTIM